MPGVLSRTALAMCLCVLALLAPLANAEPGMPDPKALAAMDAALKAVLASKIAGPTTVQLRDQAVLKLPGGYAWVPEPAASDLMRAFGNHPGDTQLGLVLPQSREQQWIAVARFEPAGYVKDDDALNWDVEGLYKTLLDGTATGNEERVAKGIPEIEIGGWVERPAYDPATHRLVWSMSVKTKGEPADAVAGINYNTYALGRDGYVSLNLLTSLDVVGRDKLEAQRLLSSLEFNEGKRYTDFDASTDNVAEYGLAALVGGVAAKKLGLLAVAAAFLAKFAKIILLAGVGAAVGISRIFRRRPEG